MPPEYVEIMRNQWKIGADAICAEWSSPEAKFTCEIETITQYGVAVKIPGGLRVVVTLVFEMKHSRAKIPE